jgi:hypothetical protein
MMRPRSSLDVKLAGLLSPMAKRITKAVIVTELPWTTGMAAVHGLWENLSALPSTERPVTKSINRRPSGPPKAQHLGTWPLSVQLQLCDTLLSASLGTPESAIEKDAETPPGDQTLFNNVAMSQALLRRLSQLCKPTSKQCPLASGFLARMSQIRPLMDTALHIGGYMMPSAHAPIRHALAKVTTAAVPS